MNDNLTLEGVYKTDRDERPFRIIGLDNVEVFYDCLWPHDKSWAISGSIKKKCYFYRTSREWFGEKSEFLKNLPFTKEEQDVFRPDLPMRFGRNRELKWNSFEVSGLEEFIAKTKTLKDNKFLGDRIEAKEIILIPYGPKGGLQKGTIVSADNEKYFGCVEALWKAKGIQESINKNTSEGIGIYRLGFEKGLPSFYIGEYKGSAGLLTK